MADRRILVVANKWWEADPLCAVLIHDRARPKSFADFTFQGYPAHRAIKPPPNAPRPADPPATPRLTFNCNGDRVEVWCIEELMNPAESSSSSLEKARVLPSAFAYGPTPALVVAFGTAGIREGVHANGSAVIGRRVFIHDPLRGAASRQGLWTPPMPDQLLESALPANKLGQFDERGRYAAEARFLTPPIDSAAPPLVLVGNGLASLGVVNITNYDDYTWADQSAVNAFAAAKAPAQIGSIETTHGIIFSASTAPFVYVSGITDTEGLFDFQVPPRLYAQNTVAAHNAAIALAWMLPSVLATL